MTPFTLRPFQTEAIHALHSKSVHLALTAPTGSGKGVILEALARDPVERILIFSPLIALARQQRVRFARLGAEKRVRILSPESAVLRAREIRAWKPTLIAVDEAHCLLEWGERFRPAYGKLLAFVRELGCPRTLWMSATFPRTLHAELIRELPGPWTQLGQFQMPEHLKTRYVCVPSTDRVECVRESVSGRPGPGLLFTGTRKEVGQYLRLVEGTRSALPYHAGLSDEERRGVEAHLDREAASGNAKTSVVATNAFGMGMNYPQFDWTILSRTPFSLLGLMQAFGRVARGEKKGSAELYWSEEDFRFAGLLTAGQTGSKRSASELALLRGFLEADEDARVEITREAFL